MGKGSSYKSEKCEGVISRPQKTSHAVTLGRKPDLSCGVDKRPICFLVPNATALYVAATGGAPLSRLPLQAGQYRR